MAYRSVFHLFSLLMGSLILSSHHHVKYASAAISTQSYSNHDTSYIVTFGDSTSYRDFVLDNHHMVIEQLPNLNMVLASIPDESDVDMLRQLNGVEHVEKDVPSTIAGPENHDMNRNLDQSPTIERHLVESVGWNIEMVGALNVSDEYVSKKKVCLLGSGYTLGHEDLPTNVTGCDDEYAPLWSVDSDPESLGTFSAGIIAALGDNDKGVVGIVRNGGLNLHIAKYDIAHGAFLSGILRSLEFCAEEAADIIALPFTLNEHVMAIETAINSLYDSNAILIGEAYRRRFPGYLSNVISVSAIDSSKNHVYGDSADLSAPGTSDIISTTADGSYGTTTRFFASSHVVGVAALAWSHYPNKTNDEIRDALFESAEDLGDEGYDSAYGYGLVRADSAVNYMQRSSTNFPSLEPSIIPSTKPSPELSSIPSMMPSLHPSREPSLRPSSIPSFSPSLDPSLAPSSVPSRKPSLKPSSDPSLLPSVVPSLSPSSVPSNIPSLKPSSKPSLLPSEEPSLDPSSVPSSYPTLTPSSIPSSEPSSIPSSQPSLSPSSKPSSKPSLIPSTFPSLVPSTLPSSEPTYLPSAQPSTRPSLDPSTIPSEKPSERPSRMPSTVPSVKPSSLPSTQPSMNPSSLPSSYPSRFPSNLPSSQPSLKPSLKPSSAPTFEPSLKPSLAPSIEPSSQPSTSPSDSPSDVHSNKPSNKPTPAPSSNPYLSPSSVPSRKPSLKPSNKPSLSPTATPSLAPSRKPSLNPSNVPSLLPSATPSLAPSSVPTTLPSSDPSSLPSIMPSSAPTLKPTMVPTVIPSQMPSFKPSLHPSDLPSTKPSFDPSVNPSAEPSRIPSTNPTLTPSSTPTVAPSLLPSFEPSTIPSALPSETPSVKPSGEPSVEPSFLPTLYPSLLPSLVPSFLPSPSPSSIPSDIPTAFPSLKPSSIPSDKPSDKPSLIPSLNPSKLPSVVPSLEPTNLPSLYPTAGPSLTPSSIPTSKPSLKPSLIPSEVPSIGPSAHPSDTKSSSPSNTPSHISSPQPTFLNDCASFGLSSQTAYCYFDTQSAFDDSDSTNWNITLIDEMKTIQNISQGVFLLSTNYTLADHHYNVEIFEDDCQTTPKGPIPLTVNDAFNKPSYATKQNDVELQFVYDQAVIQNSSIWHADEEGGTASFCIRINNFLPESETTSRALTSNNESNPFHLPVYFLETVYIIDVDSVTDFDISIDIKRTAPLDGGTDFIDYEEEIVAYTCDSSFNAISTTYTQGDAANICVETVDGSAFQVHSIRDLTVSQRNNTSDPASIISAYVYVSNYLDSRLSESSCINTNTTDAVCQTKMQLLAEWFNEDSMTSSGYSLTIDGTVKLDYLGRRRTVETPIRLRLGKLNPRNDGEEAGATRILSNDARSGFSTTILLEDQRSASKGSKMAETGKGSWITTTWVLVTAAFLVWILQVVISKQSASKR